MAHSPARTYVVLGRLAGRGWDVPLRPLGTVTAPNRATARGVAEAAPRGPDVTEVRVARASAVRPAWLMEALAADARRAGRAPGGSRGSETSRDEP
jgi:hypothetical protein